MPEAKKELARVGGDTLSEEPRTAASASGDSPVAPEPCALFVGHPVTIFLCARCFHPFDAHVKPSAPVYTSGLNNADDSGEGALRTAQHFGAVAPTATDDLDEWQRAALFKIRTWAVIQSRHRAGETITELAHDYSVPVMWVRAVLYPENDLDARYGRPTDRAKTLRTRAERAEAVSLQYRRAVNDLRNRILDRRDLTSNAPALAAYDFVIEKLASLVGLDD